MSLKDLKTDLKSLRFGKDRVYGGSSGQPYIQTPILFPDPVGALDQDFILRGGAHTAINAAEDVTRLTKYFNDPRNPSGLLFIAKQNLLSRTAVRTQASGFLINEGAYTPLSTLIEAGGVAFGLHVNKQGLNPFPGQIGSLKTYSDVVLVGNLIPPDQSTEALNNNRLVELTKSKITEEISYNPFTTGISLLPTNILTYSGGPGSVLGIGFTNIKFADQRTISNAMVQGVFPNSNGTTTYTQFELSSIPTTPLTTGKSFLIKDGSSGATTNAGDFRFLLREKNTLITKAPNYTKKNIEQRVKLGDPGNANGKNLISYTNGANPGKTTGYSGGNSSFNSYDIINALPVYQDNSPDSKNGNDLVKFRIGVINNNSPDLKRYIHFRAFLDNISDSYTSDQNSTQYVGRGEKFYTYGGFDRKVSLSWTVAAQSKAELIPMYKKLNYLASVCAPDYSSQGYMRGNLITLTIGGYFYEQPGILTGLTYEMNDDNTSWEIGINDDGDFDPTVKELPHLIKVKGFNFIPIHTFVPRLQNNTYNPEGDILTDNNTYGPERYIALNNGAENNYGIVNI